MVKKLLHTRYRVTDLEKTVRFYREVIGLAEVDRKVSPRGSKLVFLKAPESAELIEICEFAESGPVIVGPDHAPCFRGGGHRDFCRARGE